MCVFKKNYDNNLQIISNAASPMFANNRSVRVSRY